ncbi:MAG TPA: radical SAM protein [Candidatus Nitrosotenuis sp.]|nr:radical SAM protein [Candidatus Nitrosotenuis sp.]
MSIEASAASVVLIQPPQWTPQHPPFALASLGGHLRSRGIPVRLVDLNLATYLRILTPEHMEYVRQLALLRREYLLQKCRARLLLGQLGENSPPPRPSGKAGRPRGDRHPGRDNPAGSGPFPGDPKAAAGQDLFPWHSRPQRRASEEDPGGEEELERDSTHILRIDACLQRRPDPWTLAARGLPSALAVLRDAQAFYDPELLVEALGCVDLALELAALPYHPTRLALNDHGNPLYGLTLDDLERGTRDAWTNLFLPFMQEAVPDLLRGGPRLVALSINSFSQVLPGLTLARLLRAAAGPDTHLAIGGNFFGRVAHRLERLPRFFELFCHSVLVGEGEEPLERLCRAVLDGLPLDQVPDMVRLHQGTVVRTRRPSNRLPLEQVGYLDLEGLPLPSYLSPEPVVCIQGSRGCYWGRCTFCDAYWGVALDAKSVPRLVAEMAYLKERYGIRHFEFIDECLPPRDMAALARALVETGLKVHWFANARTEEGFETVVEELPRSGNTMLLWGFESANPRILRRLCKGVDPEGRWRVLRAAARAGIWNFAYVFFGFPGETHEEALDTIRALCSNTDVIHSYGRSVFTLGLHSPLARHPDPFGIADVREDGQDLSVNVSYRSLDGPTPQEVQERVALCTRLCREAYGSPLWMALRNRENLHLYLARYGTARVAQWKIRAPESEAAAFQK